LGLHTMSLGAPILMEELDNFHQNRFPDTNKV